jgi:hypothetical protein
MKREQIVKYVMPPGTAAATAFRLYQAKNILSTNSIMVSDAVDSISGNAIAKTSR